MSELESRPPSWASITIAWTVVIAVAYVLKRWWSTGRKEARIAIVVIILLAVLAVITMNVYEWATVSESLVE